MIKLPEINAAKAAKASLPYVGSLPADLWRGCAGQGSRVYSRFSLARRSEVPKE